MIAIPLTVFVMVFATFPTDPRRDGAYTPPMREPSDYDIIDLTENIMKLMWVMELVAHRPDDAQLVEDARVELWRLADELGARLGVLGTAQ